MKNCVFWIFLGVCLLGLINPSFCQQNEINKYIGKINTDPLDQSNYLKLAELYQINKNPDQVDNIFNTMLIYWPENAHIYYRWALSLSLMNEHQRSLPQYLMSLKLDATQPKVMYNYSISLVQVRKFNVALRVMEKACKLEPNNNQYLVFKNKILLSLSPNKLVDLGESDLFIVQYNEAIKNYNTKNMDIALASINQAIEIQPTNDRALLVKSQILLDQRKYKEAITILQQLIETNSHNYEAHFYLGEALYIIKEYENSFQHFYLSLPNINSKKEAINNCNSILSIMKIQNNENYTKYSEQFAPYMNNESNEKKQ